MANLTIRNVDDATVEKLKARARANNRSLEAELRLIVSETAEGTARRKLSGEELTQLARRIAAVTPAVPQTDSGVLQAEGRDER